MKALTNFFEFLFSFFLVYLRMFFHSDRGSFQVDTAFVEGFKDNIHMLSQQKAPLVWGKSRRETQNTEVDSYERIGESEANDIVDRHGDTPLNNTPHSRRQVTLQDADWGDLIDSLDRVRLLIRPDDAYVKAAVFALNRKKDDVFIAAALGIARAGKKGTVSVSLPEDRKLVAVDSAGGGSSRMNVFTLTMMQFKFDEAEVDDDVLKHFAWSGKARQQMLNDTQATSADYASVKALTTGKIDTFMGFQFHKTERLPVTAAATDYVAATGQVETGGGSVLAAGARRCFAWVEDGMVSSFAEELFVDIGPRRDKRLSTQIYARHSVGAVRLEEDLVLEVLIDETL